MSNFLSLPIDAHREEFIALLSKHPGVLVNAPPGTGKSTRIPLYCSQWLEDQYRRGGSNASNESRIVVLQPRRLAAISLASRVAFEQKSILGQKVGYQVRGAKAVSADTEILFQTYGLFFQELKSKPTLSHVSVLILDEFHERQVEMDLIWAWIHYLKNKSFQVPKIILMSATLDEKSMEKETQNWGRLYVSSPMYPIETQYMSANATETLEAQAVRATKTWLLTKPEGVCLFFLPGWGEIQKVKYLLEDLFSRMTGLKIDVLHGSMKLSEQQTVCTTTEGTRVILTTNIAETSLTIPGVTAVIDSGWEREASWQADKGVNILGLKRITLQSAEQRRGRAGRTGPGWCMRLWDQKWEKDWDLYWRSGLLKQEWASSLLGLLQLLSSLGRKSPESALSILPWLTRPDEKILQASIQVLKNIEAIDSNGIPLPGGEWMSKLPIHPNFARILYRARGTRFYKQCAAMVSIVEGAGRSDQVGGNLLVASESILENQRSSIYSSEIRELFQQLVGLESSVEVGIKNSPIVLEEIWCDCFEEQIGIRTQSNRYQLPSGFVGNIKTNPLEDIPPAVVAVDIWESTRSGKKEGEFRFWLPITPSFWSTYVQKQSTTNYVCKWLDKSQKVSVLKETSFRGTVIQSDLAEESMYPAEVVRNFMVLQILAGNIKSPLETEEIETLHFRYHLLAKSYPEYRFAEFNSEVLELLLHDWVGEKKSSKDLSISYFKSLYLDFIGGEARALLEKFLPLHITLPSGKMAKIIYFKDSPPELTARITDFAGMQGSYSLCEGRVEVVFNLLAPNYRTAQKTRNLTDFWANSYPQIKKELKGRYPRHPWP